MNNNDEFDHVLDEALAQYRDAEPLTGMEQRVLQRVRLHAERRWKLWRWWGAVAACAAMLAVAAWIGWRDRVRRQEIVPMRPAMAQQQRPPVESQAGNVNAHASHEPAPRRALIAKAPSRSPNVAGPALSASAKAPVRPQFPSPTPLNSEERALLMLAQTHPETLSHLQGNQDDREIAIAPINIQPLVNEASHKQGEN